MSVAAEAVVDAWDRLVALAEQIGPDDWQRPTPCPDSDVAGLVAHVAGPGAWQPAAAGAAGDPVEALRGTRATQVGRIAAVGGDASHPTEDGRGERMLRASCADLWVHTYDLTTGLGEDFDLDENSATLAQACQYLLGLTPALVASRLAPGEAADLRVALRGGVEHDRTLAVRNSQARWDGSARAGSEHLVAATPAAFVLLLSGRGDPGQLRNSGVLEWSGAHGEAFVRRARLYCC
ncbi:MAG: maleylpyruvate isomerase N-terminal domain-containing protein [Actinomycetota bacterium]|nr:maleylpyruvate isomerase N-terminal domain-containing protein [Actinomycetota bacterium]